MSMVYVNKLTYTTAE